MNCREQATREVGARRHDRPVLSAWLAIIAWCAVWGALGIIWMMGG